ncbi:MAG: hypothetical protein A4E57_04871 [Syntrophorhabdaceae bacterium PtaU1.Bin034]|nr:MAG: hypothetical protein A4E57_04871 [Syntrophorhabdaceae bacterium PtaU1.Bin034]
MGNKKRAFRLITKRKGEKALDGPTEARVDITLSKNRPSSSAVRIAAEQIREMKDRYRQEKEAGRARRNGVWLLI